MNNRQILASINEIANELEDLGFMREASELTGIMKRLAQTVGNPSAKPQPNQKPKTKPANYNALSNESFVSSISTLRAFSTYFLNFSFETGELESQGQVLSSDFEDAIQDLEKIYAKVYGTQAPQISAGQQPSNIVQARDSVSAFVKNEMTKWQGIDSAKDYLQSLQFTESLTKRLVNEHMLGKSTPIQRIEVQIPKKA